MERPNGYNRWMAWKSGIGDMGSYIRNIVDEDPAWYHAYGSEMRIRSSKKYDSRAMDWHMLTSNQCIGVLDRHGLEFREIFFPTVDEYIPGSVAGVFTERPEGFVVVDPGPKSIEDLREKLRAEGCKDYSQIFDFLRITLVGADQKTCEEIQTRILSYGNEYGFLAPLTDEERTLTTGRVVPITTPVGNKQSAPELLELVHSGHGFAQTSRFQIGPEAIDRGHFRYATDPPHIVHYFPPPGLRVSVTVLTPEIFEFMNDPESPAHHSRYAERKRQARRPG